MVCRDAPAGGFLYLALTDAKFTEAILPFDMEFLYAAALNLLMASAIFPDLADSQPYTLTDVHSILDETIRKGNRVAEARKAELRFLEHAFREFTLRAKQQEVQIMSWSDAVEGMRGDADPNVSHEPGTQQPATVAVHDGPRTQEPSMDRGAALLDAITGGPGGLTPTTPNQLQLSEQVEFLDNIGISSDDFLSIVDRMDHQDYRGAGINHTEYCFLS